MRKCTGLEAKDITSANGYHSTRRVYECTDCSGCPMKSDCSRSKSNRRLYIGVELLQMRKQAQELLNSPKGVKLRSQRPIEVEAVYGRLKHTWGLRRFMLKGMDKVKIEWGLLNIAHNIAKVAVQ